MHTPPRGVLFDVDGTLVDSNDANAHAWVDAMQMEGHEVAFDTVRPLIGMGADKVLPQVLGIAKETDEGQRISQHRKDIYKQQYMPHLNAFPGALELLERMRGQGLKLIIATTAEPEELQGVLPLLGPNASTLFAGAATAKEAGRSKPDGDVVQVAVERSGYRAEELVMIGDTPYDSEAAAKVGVQTIAFRSGGWSDEDLTKAIAVYDGPADLLAHYETSVFVTGKETRNDSPQNVAQGGQDDTNREHSKGGYQQGQGNESSQQDTHVPGHAELLPPLASAQGGQDDTNREHSKGGYQQG